MSTADTSSSTRPFQAGTYASNAKLRKYMAVGLRYAWLAGSLFAMVMTIGILRLARTTPIYQATAKILVERQSPRLMKFDDVMQQGPMWGEDYYKTQEGLVGSRAVLEVAMRDPAIADLATTASPPRPSVGREVAQTLRAALGGRAAPVHEPWERLKSMVFGERVSDTQFLRVKAEHPDPQVAKRIANAVAQAFVHYHVQRKHDLSGEAFTFLEQQRKREEESLRNSETALAAFRQSARNTSFDVATEGHPVFKKLARINEQLTETQIQRIEFNAQLQQLNDSLREGAAPLVANNEQLFALNVMRNDAAVAEIRSLMRKAEQNAAALANVYGPSHPQMEAAQTEVSLLADKLRAALLEIQRNVASKVALLKEQEEKLRTEYEEQNQMSLGLVNESVTFSRLQNEVDRHQKLLDVLVGRMREVELTGEYERSNAELIEAATLPSLPIRPRKLRSVILTALLGLFLAVGAVITLEYMDDTIRTPEDMEERLGVTVLGFVPHISHRPKSADAEGAAPSSRGMAVLHEPRSSIIEAYRNIRTSLLFSAPASEVKTIVVTSAGAGDGKTTTSCNLAIMMAAGGRPVLLIDADMRRPTIHKALGLDNEKGFSNVLVGDAPLDQCLHKVTFEGQTVPNLDVLTAGLEPPNTTELVESSAAREFIRAMREKYDRVIIDSPPVLFVSDAAIFSSYCDGAILVVRAAKNARSMGLRARRQLLAAKARILGGILNDVTRWSQFSSEYYYYGYSRYYRDYYRSYYSGESAEAKQSQQNSA